MSEGFKKIIQLLNSNQDRCIVVDQNGDPLYVIMTCQEFQSIIGRHHEVAKLSEKEFLDKINRDIALWKSAQESEIVENWEAINPKKTSDDANQLKENKEEIYYFEPID